MHMQEADVAILGAGMSGLAAGLRAAQAGARVVLLERAGEVGGNANHSAGMFLAARDADALHAYIPDGDPVLQELFCTTFDAALGWLADGGLPLGDEIGFGDFRVVRPMGLGRPGDRAPFLTALADRVAAAGAEIRQGVGAPSVRRDGDSFAIATTAGDGVRARRLVVATGGFAASRARLADALGPEAASSLMIRSRPEADGAGQSIAEGLGAARSRNQDRFYGHLMPDCAIPPDRWQPATPYFSRQGIVVNRAGRRFTDESEGLLEETNPQAACRQPGGKVHLLFDIDGYHGVGADQGTNSSLPGVDWLALAAELEAPLVEVGTLDGLATVLAADGVDADAAMNELEAYNGACRAGRAGDLAPPRRSNALPIVKAPFFALRCVPAVTATAGGIAVDARCRALDGGSRPVPGLYVAGVDAGGVYGRTYGGFLAWSLVSGYIAGAAAAAG